MVANRNKKETSRRQDILRAARTVMAARNYHDVRVGDIAAEAGLGKGTLYLYFRDKESLVDAVIENLIDDLGKRLKDLPLTGSAVDGLQLIAAEILDFVDENRRFLARFPIENPGLRGERARKAIERRFTERLCVVAEGIARGVQQGVVRRHDPVLSGHFFIALVRMFMTRKVMERADMPLRLKAPELMELFLVGLGSAKESRIEPV